MINLSQICKSARLLASTRLLAPPASLKADAIHGIDFKNPFTMSKRAVTAQHLAVNARISCLHPWKR
jgi:hypothetical protein